MRRKDKGHLDEQSSEDQFAEEQRTGDLRTETGQSAEVGETRRTFLGLGGAAAGIALLEGCAQPETTLIEQALKRGPGNPGSATWQRSICRQCCGGCELKVRIIDGRAKKIEGDQTSLVNRGGVCALGHSALQELYHPHRCVQPAERESDGNLRPVAWEEALDALSSRFARAAGSPGALAICCGPEPTERALFARLARGIGASLTIVEPPHSAIEREARRQFFGKNVELLYDLDDSDFFWASGASILDRWGNPVYFARSVAEARARGVRFAVSSRRFSLTAAKADLWVPILGSAGPLFRAVSRIVNGVPVDLGQLARSSAEILGIPIDRLEQLVQGLMAARRPALLLGAEGGETVEDLVAGFALQRDLGILPEAVSVQALASAEDVAAERGPLRRRTLSELKDAIDDDTVTMVITHADLLGAVPESWGMAERLAAPEGPCLVALASGPDATSDAADWLLPRQVDLERQQLGVPVFGVSSSRQLTMHVADPVVATRGLARHPLDILLALSAASSVSVNAGPGGQAGTSEFESASSLRESVVGAVGELGGQSAKSALRRALRAQGRLPVREEASRMVVAAVRSPYEVPYEVPGEAVTEASPNDGAGVRGDAASNGGTQRFTLVLFEGVRGEASGGGRPWLAEVPDPVSSAQWGSWLEMHPADADGLGLETGSSIHVASRHGGLWTTVFVRPAMRPGTVAIPVGVLATAENGLSDARDLLGLAQHAGYPVHQVEVALSMEGSDAIDPTPFLGRSVHTAERIPSGWKSHGDEPISRTQGGRLAVLGSSGASSQIQLGSRSGSSSRAVSLPLLLTTLDVRRAQQEARGCAQDARANQPREENST